MDKPISELRKRIEQATADQGGRKVFPAGLRDDVVALALAWMSRGKSRAELARRLGMNGGTLAYWMERHAPAARPETRVRPVRVLGAERASVRPVRVLDAEVASAPPATVPSIVLPSGARIEGLTMDQLLTLARALA